MEEMVEDREKEEEPESPCCTTTRTAINHDKDNIAWTISEKEGNDVKTVQRRGNNGSEEENATTSQ